jgi:hypothetical protein
MSAKPIYPVIDLGELIQIKRRAFPEAANIVVQP